MEINKHLAEHYFIRSLPKKYIELLQKNMEEKNYRSGEYLFYEGRKADAFHYIITGKVALEMHTPGNRLISFETVPKGHIIGWSWLMPPYTWSFDGRAVREVNTLRFNAEKIRAESEKDHELGYYLHRYFSTILNRRLISSRVQLLDIYQAKGGDEYI